MLRSLTIKNVGPAPELNLELGERLNIITGDNGLGKSFLLDIAWWALTRRWPAELNPNLTSGYMARPKPDAKASISFAFGSKTQKTESYESTFNHAEQAWTGPAGRPSNPGLVLYAQVDGSFAVWDPARNGWKKQGNIDVQERQPAYVFSPKQVWDGLQGEKGEWLCNGLIRDWASWQRENSSNFGLLKTIIKALSPSNELIGIGYLTRVSISDVRDIPTLKMPNGEEVPVIYASAGVRRIIALAYLLVWVWKEHMLACSLLGINVSNQVIFLVDEIETHLHPSWQRSVLIPLFIVVTTIIEGLYISHSKSAQVQVITTTHSPLVMASVESKFDSSLDAWFDLDLVTNGEKSKIELTRRIWQRHGDVSNWLMSEAFDLKSGRSLDAEQTLEEASNAMVNPQFGKAEAQALHKKLAGVLGDTDPFWINWRYVAEKKGWLE